MEGKKPVKPYLKGKINVDTAASTAGVSSGSAETWITSYKAGGAKALSQEKNNIDAPELKKKAGKEYLNGEGSQSDICRQ